MTALFEESYDTIAQFIGAPEPGQHRAVPEHDRGHQRGHVLAADRVPRRRQRRDHDDGAQLQLRAVVRDVPGDPAPAGAAGGLPAGAVRPGHRRAGPGSPGLADRRADQAGVLHRRVELPRHPRPDWPRSGRWPTPAGTGSPAGSGGRTCWSTAPSWCRDRSSTCRPWTWTSWRSPSTRCWRRSGSGCCTPGSTCSPSALPFLYGGDMIAEGRVFPEQVEYNALPWKYAAGTPNILGTIVSAQALRLLLDLALTPNRPAYFGTGQAPRARRRPRRHEPRHPAWNTAADQPGTGRARPPSRDHHLRAARCGAPHLAGRVQHRRP